MVITDGGTLLGIRIDDGKPQLDPENSKCPGFIEVCCRKTDFFEEPIRENEEVSMHIFAPCLHLKCYIKLCRCVHLLIC